MNRAIVFFYLPKCLSDYLSYPYYPLSFISFHPNQLPHLHDDDDGDNDDDDNNSSYCEIFLLLLFHLPLLLLSPCKYRKENVEKIKKKKHLNSRILFFSFFVGFTNFFYSNKINKI
jgi:hypothetical protein